MGPMWGRQDPDGPHVGPMDFVIWVGSADELPPPKRQVVTWTNAEVLSIGPLGKNFSESWTIFTYFDSRKLIWKWCLPNVGLFCSCLSVSATDAIFQLSRICQSIGTDTFFGLFICRWQPPISRYDQITAQPRLMQAIYHWNIIQHMCPRCGRYNIWFNTCSGKYWCPDY